MKIDNFEPKYLKIVVNMLKRENKELFAKKPFWYKILKFLKII